MTIQPSSLPPPSPRQNKLAARFKTTCKHCIRARWLMTFLILTSMSLILYLHEFSG